MDFCRINLSNASDTISFKSIVILMIHLATIILTLSTESIDNRLTMPNFNSTYFKGETVIVKKKKQNHVTYKWFN